MVCAGSRAGVCARCCGVVLSRDAPFEDEGMEEGAGVTDLINKTVQVLRRDLYWFRISAREAELMEPVEPWDEG